MARPPRTVHVALTDGERLWVGPDGELPHFVHDPEAGGPTPTATASSLLTDAVHLAPVVTLDEGSRLHVVGSRGGTPTDGRWIRVDALPDELHARVATAAGQHWGTPPERRPAWYRPGWHEAVETWVDEALSATDRTRTGRLRTHRVWSISAVHTIPTDRGSAWFKASCDHFGAEAAIVATVATHLPGLVPQVIAVDRERSWLLTEPLPGVSEDGASPDAAEALSPLWAAAQLDSTRWLGELRSAGAPDRGLEPTLSAWREALATNTELDELTDDERGQLASAIPVVESRLRELWACGFPDTLAHGDLHSGNVAHDGQHLRIFDWSDGCTTHPFLDGTHLAHWLAEADGTPAEQHVRTVLAPWREAFPAADFERAVELAPLADLVFQTVTFDGLTRSIEPGTGDFDGIVAMLTRKVLAVVSA
ncbi:aminoglycoside phosphotransferase family protein [Nocardioides oleivorans]|uniref:Aminoglycoside phosphotransferase family protein n=1 Tax=Nocardioides oleivorans TaxID=273676 RepID=A0A4Q2RZ23_9ACTN|nr:aminoglycoside phosphotransferase family protein [Nocardioides oleivorans]RYB94378.1 aminoglycoside phosphotransferase family protein [Nocardioides oleivorans]